MCQSRDCVSFREASEIAVICLPVYHSENRFVVFFSHLEILHSLLHPNIHTIEHAGMDCHVEVINVIQKVVDIIIIGKFVQGWSLASICDVGWSLR